MLNYTEQKRLLFVWLSKERNSLKNKVSKLQNVTQTPSSKELIQIYTFRMEWLRLQMEELKGKTYTPENADDYESGVEEVIEYK